MQHMQNLIHLPGGGSRKHMTTNISTVLNQYNMEDAWQPEALRNRRLEQLRATMDDYITKNAGQVELNLPVFFGHVAATLDKTFPELDDRTYDDFIDATASTLLNITREAPTPEFLEKVLRHAMGNKRRRKGRAALDVVVALKLIDSGNYYQAIEYLTPTEVMTAASAPQPPTVITLSPLQRTRSRGSAPMTWNCTPARRC